MAIEHKTKNIFKSPTDWTKPDGYNKIYEVWECCSLGNGEPLQPFTLIARYHTYQEAFNCFQECSQVVPCVINFC